MLRLGWVPFIVPFIAGTIYCTIYCRYRVGVPLLLSLQQLLHPLNHQLLQLLESSYYHIPTHLSRYPCSYVLSYPAHPRGYCPWKLRSITALMDLVTRRLETLLYSLRSTDSFNARQPNYGECNLPVYCGRSSTKWDHDLETSPQCWLSIERER